VSTSTPGRDRNRCGLRQHRDRDRRQHPRVSPTPRLAALVDGLSYTDTTFNPGDPARVVVTITQLHDTGGTTPGVDTSVLNITSTVFFGPGASGHRRPHPELHREPGRHRVRYGDHRYRCGTMPIWPSATVQITGGYVNGEDVLGFTTQNGITGSFQCRHRPR